MAVFTICALIRSENYCPAVFNNHQFEIVAFLGSYNGKQNIAGSKKFFKPRVIMARVRHLEEIIVYILRIEIDFRHIHMILELP
jgi:hypothetical protein